MIVASKEKIDENIVLIEGRLSLREDEEPKIVANNIREFASKTKKILSIDISNLDEDAKNKLRGALKFFMGEKNNMAIQIIDGEQIKPAGGIYLNDAILRELQEVAGADRVKLVEV